MERIEVEQKVAAIMERHMAKVDRSVLSRNDFENGSIYVQHCKEQLEGVLEASLRLAHEACPGYRNHVDSWVVQNEKNVIDSPKLKQFFIQYFVEDESEVGLVLQVLARRIMKIDFDDATEWGQGYFSIGDGRGSAAGKICVNPGEALAAWEAKELRASLGKDAASESVVREGPRL